MDETHSFSVSSRVVNHPPCRRTLGDSGQGDGIPFAPDGRKNHLLPLIVNCEVQKGGVLLVQDDVSVVAQKKGDSFGVAFPCRKVQRRVLSEKQERENSGTMANHPSAIIVICFLVELLKRYHAQNYLIPRHIKFKTGVQNRASEP